MSAPKTNTRGPDSGAPQLVRKFYVHQRTILGLDFHPTLAQLASCGADTFTTLWNYDEDDRAWRSEGHSARINDIQYSLRGDLLATASDDQTIRIMVPTIRGEVRSFRGHTAKVRSVSFNPGNPDLMASSSNDKTIKLWSIDWKAKLTKPSLPKTRHNTASEVSPAPSKFSRRYGQFATFIKSFPKVHTNWVRSVRFSTDGNILISASDDRSVAVLDVRSHELVVRISHHLGSPTFAAFNPCAGHYIGSSLLNGSFTIHDMRNLQPVQVFSKLHETAANHFAFHPSGDYAVTVGDDARAKVLDLLEGRPMYTLHGSRKDLHAVSFSPDGSLFAMGGADRELLLWKSVLTPYEAESDDDAAENSENAGETLEEIKEPITSAESLGLSLGSSSSSFFLKEPPSEKDRSRNASRTLLRRYLNE